MNPNKISRVNGIASLLAITLALGASQQCSKAVPYASGISNNSGTISFTLNEDADNVKVILNDVTTTTNDLGALAKGIQSFTLGTATNFQILVKKVSTQGFVTASGTNAPVMQISKDTNALLNFATPRGLVINKNPSSPYFGRIYVANSSTATTTSNSVSRVTGDGIYMLNADQSDALGLGDTASTGGLDFTSGALAAPWRLTLGQDDTLYISDWSDATGNLYYTDPNVISGGPVLKPLSAPGAAALPVGAANTHGSIAAAYVEGSLAAGNLKVYTIDEDLQSNKTSTTKNQEQSLWRYDVLGGPLPFNSDATRVWTPNTKEGINFTSGIYVDMDRGADGKFYTSTYRINGLEGGIIVHDATGSTTLFNSYLVSTNMLGNASAADFLRQTFAVAVSPDQSFLAVVRDDSRTWILPLTNGVPDLSKRLWLNSFSSILYARAVKFDAAGNLYVLSGAAGSSASSSTGPGTGAQVLRIFSPGGTTIAVTGNDATGTNGTFSVTRIDPDIAIQPQNVTVNAGVNATFSVNATGVGTLKYQWTFNGANISGATASTFTRTAAQDNVAGNYSVIITNAAGTASITSSVVSLTVVDTAPLITIQPVGLTNAAGTAPKLTVTATGTTNITYQWRLNGTNLSGATTTALTLSNAQAEQSGPYTVVLSNPLGTTTSSVANVLITNAPPVFNAQPKSQTVNAGVNVTFSSTLTQASTNNLTYQWFLNGVEIPGATGASYITNDVQSISSGSIYTVTVTNLFGSITSTNAILTVNDVLAILSTQPKSQTNGAGSNIVFTVSTSAGTDPRTYQWQFQGIDILDATNTSLVLTNIQFSDAGTYSVYVVNPLGTTVSTNAVLTITNRAPIITAAPASVSTNAGGSAAFTINANGATNLTYQWSFAGSDISGATDSTLNLSNVQLADAGFYTVVVGSGAGTYFTTNSAAQLAVTIPSTAGTGTGVRGDYYTVQNQTFTNAPTLTRIDTNIDFNFGTGSPDPSISVDRFTVRWTGQVQPLYSQDYTFYTRSDDGARLWINGQLVVNRWQGQSVTEIASAPISLTAGQKYDLVMEYFEGTSTAEVHLLWSSLSQVKSAVPMTQLYPAATGSAVTPVLNSSFNGTNSVFNWTGSFTLQTAVSIDGPWTNAAALGVGPFTYTNSQAADGQRYFRLKAN